ncbi:hypothetical protein JFV26_32470 [Pseudomonas sp. TH31]|uniref:hypothetical protein n=1 Tax=Pseudomonas sp. TH31 TaxID=2796396 RepID=UPI001911D5D7|nr:hypothetical protein [Pseudomonas sp. TH31]MBK5418570.1 hypothetical protein [Pseudomonas sp. TH31]
MQPLLHYFKMLLNPGFGALLLALRTIIAGLLTLYLAFLFDLDQPKWSIRRWMRLKTACAPGPRLPSPSWKPASLKITANPL